MLDSVTKKERQRRGKCRKDRVRVREKGSGGRFVGAAETRGELTQWQGSARNFNRQSLLNSKVWFKRHKMRAGGKDARDFFTKTEQYFGL